MSDAPRTRPIASEQIAHLLHLARNDEKVMKLLAEEFILNLTLCLMDEGARDREYDLRAQEIKNDFVKKITLIRALVAGFLFSFVLVLFHSAGWITMDSVIVNIIGYSIIGEVVALILLLMKFVFGRAR